MIAGSASGNRIGTDGKSVDDAAAERHRGERECRRPGVYRRHERQRRAGNFIGTDVTGTVNLGNGSDGIQVESGAFDNTIGGTTAGAGNLITDNGGPGVVAASAWRHLRRQPDHRQPHLRQHGTSHRPRRRRGHCTIPPRRARDPTTSRTSRSSSRPPTASSRAGWAAARPTRPSASTSSPAPATAPAARARPRTTSARWR